MDYKIAVLQNAIWDNSAIAEFTGWEKTKCSNVHQKAVINFNGACLAAPKHGVYRDAVLKVLGINLNQELETQRVVIELMKNELQIKKLKKELEELEK